MQGMSSKDGQVWELQVGPFKLRARICLDRAIGVNHDGLSGGGTHHFWLISCNGRVIDTALRCSKAGERMLAWANRADLLERRLLDLGA